MINLPVLSKFPISPLEYCFLALLFVMPLWPEYAVIKFGSMPGLNLQRLMLVALLSFWAVSMLLANCYRQRLKRFIAFYPKLVLVLVALFAWKYFSVVGSPELLRSFFGATKDMVFYGLMMLVSVTICVRREQLFRAVLVLVVSSVVVCLLSFPEAVMQKNYIAEHVPVSSEYSERAVEIKLRDEGYRTQATFANPLSLSQYLVYLLPFMIALVAVKKSSTSKKLALLAVFLAIPAILTTGSRSPIAIIMMLVGMYFLVSLLQARLSGRKKYGRVALLIVGIGAGVMALSYVVTLVQGRTESEAGSSYYRELQLEIGMPLLMQHPLLGYGPGQAANKIGMIANTVDNYFLTISLESGIPFLLLFVVLMVMMLKLLWDVSEHARGELAYIARAGFYALIGYSISLYVISLEQVMPMTYIVTGMILAVHANEQARQPDV